MKLDSDEHLVELCRGGSEQAFQEIVERYREPLIRYCRRFTGSSDAEDIVQQAFERTLPVLKDPARELVLKPWLYRVTHNLAVNQLSSRRALPSDDLDHPGREAPAPEDELEQSQRFAGLVQEIDKLPERQRAALLMRDFEGLSYEEMARALDSNKTNARKLTQLARKRLRDGLGVLVPTPILSFLSRRLGMAAAKLSATVSGGSATVAQFAVAISVLAGIVLVPITHGPPEPARAAPVTGGPAGATPVASTGEQSAVSGRLQGDERSGSPVTEPLSLARAPSQVPLAAAPSTVPSSTVQSAAVGGQRLPQHALAAPAGKAPASNVGGGSARDVLAQKREAVRAERAETLEMRGLVKEQRADVRDQRANVVAERQKLESERQKLTERRRSLREQGLDRRSRQQSLAEQRDQIRQQRQSVRAEQRKVRERVRDVFKGQGAVQRQQGEVHRRQGDVGRQQALARQERLAQRQAQREARRQARPQAREQRSSAGANAPAG